MKKTFLFVVVVIVAASCKPKYKCYCTRAGGADTTITLGKMSSTDAQTTCTNFNRNNPAFTCGVTE